jgi:hypothetical protein
MRTSLIAFCTAILLACGGMARGACPDSSTFRIEVSGSSLCVFIADSSLSQRQPLLRTWIERSARIVAAYYARFPAPQVVIEVRGMDGTGVGGGRTTNDAALKIQVRVGRDSSDEGLASDWVLVHEMVHLALPEVGRTHDWLAEGLATYVEGVARAQFGNRDISDVWAEDRHSMPMGLPRAGEGGMDQTSSWGRTYWGGALFCLQADIAIRQQTANKQGLQSALRAILRETGGYGFDTNIADVLRIGDAATGTQVLSRMYQQMRASAQVTDLDLLWTQLGVPSDPKSQPFDDHAPLAAIRIAITAKSGS